MARAADEVSSATAPSSGPTVRTPDGVTEASHYTDRKLGGKCTYSRRCERPLAPDSQLCDRHLRKERRRVSSAQKQSRDNNRELGLCAFCPVKSTTYRCMSCAVKHRQIPTPRTPDGVTADRQQLIAARTRTHADGRTRYHGQQRRGQQPVAQLNRQDIGMAESSFADFKRALAVIDTAEFKAMPRIQRDAARDAVAGLGDLTCRFIDDVLERLGHFKSREGAR